MLYRNIGAAFSSEAGERVERGDVFRPSPRDLAMRPQKLVPVTRHEAAAEGHAEKSAVDAATAADWHLDTPPAEYLKRYPDGPRADLARQLTEDA